jgi:transposase
MHYLGVDVAKASHQCVILDNGGETLGKSFTILSSKDDFDKIIRKIDKYNISKNDIVIGLEATGNLWENLYSFLTENSFKVIILNPFQTHKYHQALLKKAKTDAIDAYVIAGLLRSGHAGSSHIPEEDIQSLRDLVRLKDGYLKDMKTYKRKAYSLLNLVFPELLKLVKDPFNVVTSDILMHYQTALDFKNLKVRHLLKIARSHKGNNYDEAWAQKVITAAKDSIFSGRAHNARSITLKSLICQIKHFKEQIDMLETEILSILKPDDSTPNTPADNLLTIPGVGPHTTACVLAEIGDVQRFSSCKDFIGFVGLYPQIQQSGTSLNKARLTTKGSRLLKHALYLSSVACLKHNAYLRNLYNKKVSQGKAPKQALIVVARKLASIMYSMLKNDSIYDINQLAIVA